MKHPRGNDLSINPENVIIYFSKILNVVIIVYIYTIISIDNIYILYKGNTSMRKVISNYNVIKPWRHEYNNKL